MEHKARHLFARVPLLGVATGALLLALGCGPAEDGRTPRTPAGVGDPTAGMGQNGTGAACQAGNLWCSCNGGLCEGDLVCTSDDICALVPGGGDGGSTTAASDSDAESTGSAATDDSTSGDGPGGETGQAVESDLCANAGSGSGHYCGDSLGGDASTLYLCSADGETVQSWVGDECPNGCTQCAPGTADYCPGGITPVGACVQLSCGQTAEIAGWEQPQCEVNGNGACGGEGPETFDCDHCCDL